MIQKESLLSRLLAKTQDNLATTTPRWVVLPERDDLPFGLSDSDGLMMVGRGHQFAYKPETILHDWCGYRGFGGSDFSVSQKFLLSQVMGGFFGAPEVQEWLAFGFTNKYTVAAGALARQGGLSVVDRDEEKIARLGRPRSIKFTFKSSGSPPLKILFGDVEQWAYPEMLGNAAGLVRLSSGWDLAGPGEISRVVARQSVGFASDGVDDAQLLKRGLFPIYRGANSALDPESGMYFGNFPTLGLCRVRPWWKDGQAMNGEIQWVSIRLQRGIGTWADVSVCQMQDFNSWIRIRPIIGRKLNEVLLSEHGFR